MLCVLFECEVFVGTEGFISEWRDTGDVVGVPVHGQRPWRQGRDCH